GRYRYLHSFPTRRSSDLTIASLLFGIRDPKVLAAAVLHDTIEDTTTDYDDLAERFGKDVADWVASLTKDMRRPEDEREEEYRARSEEHTSELQSLAYLVC